MNAIEFGVNVFVALFALLDPIGNIPIFAAATAGATFSQRLSVNALLSAFVVAFMLFFFATGLALLDFFGISLAAFRIGGGLLLFLLGLDMVRENFLESFSDPDALADAQDVRGYARRRFQRLVVPFAMPLIIGPGAISATIIQASGAAELGPIGWAAGVVAIVAAGLATFACFALSGPIGRLLGDVGMAIVVRVLGLILVALGVQFVLAGLGEALPGMFASSVTQPAGH